jgi:hypothetical protein
MIDASGGLANFIAILIPALMGGFYGYRCLFLTQGFIAQYGLGAGSEFMVKLSGTYTFTQSLIYVILLLTSPAGAWSVFAFWHDPSGLVPCIWVYDCQRQMGAS